MSKEAEEYLKENYSKLNDWRVYPPSESMVIKLMESYHQHRLEKDMPSELLKQRDELLGLVEVVHGSFGGGNIITFSENDIERFKNAINQTK